MIKFNVLVFLVICMYERESVFYWVMLVLRNFYGLYGIDKFYFEFFVNVLKNFRVGILLEDYCYNVVIENGFKVKVYDLW